MRGLRIHHLVIKEGAKVVGLLSARDLPRGGVTDASCENVGDGTTIVATLADICEPRTLAAHS
jgi:hypothetical protein